MTEIAYPRRFYSLVKLEHTIFALPFAYVFIAGVFADLLETHQTGLVLGVLAGVVLAHAMFSVLGLTRM